jgi:hypothetical protein
MEANMLRIQLPEQKLTTLMKMHFGCLHTTVTLYGRHNGCFSYIP